MRGCRTGYTFRDSGLEVVKSERKRLAVFVVLNDRLTGGLGWFELFLLFALFHFLGFVGPLFLASTLL